MTSSYATPFDCYSHQVWAEVGQWLNSRHLAALLLTGDPNIAMVLRAVKYIKLHGKYYPIISLLSKVNEWVIPMKQPLWCSDPHFTITFPKGLRNLSLTTSTDLHEVILPPGLTSLSLATLQKRDTMWNFWKSRVRQLRYLTTLNVDGVVTIEDPDHDETGLPPGLTSLDLHTVKCTTGPLTKVIPVGLTRLCISQVNSGNLIGIENVLPNITSLILPSKELYHNLANNVSTFLSPHITTLKLTENTDVYIGYHSRMLELLPKTITSLKIAVSSTIDLVILQELPLRKLSLKYSHDQFNLSLPGLEKLSLIGGGFASRSSRVVVPSSVTDLDLSQVERVVISPETRLRKIEVRSLNIIEDFWNLSMVFCDTVQCILYSSSYEDMELATLLGWLNMEKLEVFRVDCTGMNAAILLHRLTKFSKLHTLSISEITPSDLSEHCYYVPTSLTKLSIRINSGAIRKINALPPSLRYLSVSGIQITNLLSSCPDLLELHICSWDLTTPRFSSSLINKLGLVFPKGITDFVQKLPLDLQFLRVTGASVTTAITENLYMGRPHITQPAELALRIERSRHR